MSLRIEISRWPFSLPAGMFYCLVALAMHGTLGSPAGPPALAALVASYILVLLGVLLGLVGDIMILTAVYRRGAILFICCLVLPFAAWAFALVHVRRLWLPLVLSVGGVLMGCAGVWLTGSGRFAEVLFG